MDYKVWRIKWWRINENSLYTPGKYIRTFHPVPSSCIVCQPVLIESNSDKKYRLGVPYKVPTTISKLD